MYMLCNRVASLFPSFPPLFVQVTKARRRPGNEASNHVYAITGFITGNEASNHVYASLEPSHPNFFSLPANEKKLGRLEAMYVPLWVLSLSPELDPNYKPVFTASCSKIPVKKSTSAKFDQLHQRRFNR